MEPQSQSRLGPLAPARAEHSRPRCINSYVLSSTQWGEGSRSPAVQASILGNAEAHIGIPCPYLELNDRRQEYLTRHPAKSYPYVSPRISECWRVHTTRYAWP